MNKIDSFKHQGLRRKLVAQLKEKGIENSAVLEAINKIPRHFFMDNAFLDFAYQDDKAFPILCGQTISQPFTVAFQTQLLDPQKNEKVLEIGTGSGYQSCVLAELGVKLFTMERFRELHEESKKQFELLGYKTIKSFFGDGFKGQPAYAPYDKILVTCGAPSIPQALVDQLKIGGLMVIPVGAGKEQIMTTVLKKSATEIEIIELTKFKFVPMLAEKSR
ncbi:MAG: protein-L-isoaspartate(D-aspartate) O-methyltransferase [Bacteroidota bacterium]